MAWLRERWLRFWFAPAGPEALGLCRAAFYVGILLFYGREDFSEWGAVSRELYLPRGLFRVLGVPPLGPEALGALGIAWKASLALAAVGLFSRVSMAAAAGLGVYLLGLRQSFGKVDHDDLVAALALFVLALSRAGDGFSLDRALAGRRGAPPPAPSGEYTWPARTVQVALAIAFFAAGVSKLRVSGLAWASSGNLANMLVARAYRTPDYMMPLAGLNLVLARHALLCGALGWFTLCVETLQPLALASRRARLLLVPGAVCLLVGIRVFLGPRFEPMIACHVFWLPYLARR